MQLPTIPSFSANETSVLHLQQLSQAVRFCTVASNIPMWRFWKQAGQTLTASTWNTMVFGQVAIDTDGISSNQNATLQTQGYYRTEACVAVQGATSTIDFQLSFLFTAGPNNAHLASGATVRYGGHASNVQAVTTNDYSLNINDMCPVVCYPGDTIVVQAWVTTGTNTTALTNTSATSGWFAPQFSGRWVRTGS